MSMEELANCGLRFRSFKPGNTLTLDALKGEKKQISYKKGTYQLKSKMQSPSKVFRTQNETKSGCVMNLYAKSSQAQCG